MSKMISVASGFQYSVNIGYDLNNDDKLKILYQRDLHLNSLRISCSVREITQRIELEC